MTGSGQPGNGVPADIHTDIAHPARVYDYWLGGKDNFAADGAAAEQVQQVMPEILDTVRGNPQFLVRAVRFLRDAGIRQFIDLGSGLPSSPNVHEVAQSGDTGARVVYVDNDPVVSVHAEALMARNHTTAVVQADLRDVDEVLSRAGELLDFARQAGLLFVGSYPTSWIPTTRPALWPGTWRRSRRAATWSSRMPPMSARRRRCARTPRWPRAAAPCSSPRQGRDLAHVQRARADRSRAGPGLLLAAGRR